MARGRPKGSKNKNSKNQNKKDIINVIDVSLTTSTISASVTNDSNENVNIQASEKSSKLIKKSKENIVLCDKCHKEVVSTPIVINLSYLTGQATWHRDCKLEKIHCCTQCARELNEIIDKWILKDNSQYLKYQSKEIT